MEQKQGMLKNLAYSKPLLLESAEQAQLMRLLMYTCYSAVQRALRNIRVRTTSQLLMCLPNPPLRPVSTGAEGSFDGVWSTVQGLVNRIDTSEKPAALVEDPPVKSSSSDAIPETRSPVSLKAR